MSQEICGYGLTFNALATDARAEFCTVLTFHEFLAKPHRVLLALGHNGAVLTPSIELHIDSAGVAFRAEVGAGAWSLLRPRMLHEGFTHCSIGFFNIVKEPRIYRGRYIYELTSAGIDHVAITNAAAFPQGGCWPSDHELEDPRLAQLRYRFKCAERNRSYLRAG